MSSSLTNTLVTFCNLMNQVLYDFLDNFVVVYLDDIVAYSNSLDVHVMNLRLVFTKLKEFQLYVKKEKYEFIKQKIKFLGHIIG